MSDRWLQVDGWRGSYSSTYELRGTMELEDDQGTLRPAPVR